ncbi:hypothetical protein V8C86DRAFT_2543370 [Haematococcus lacustris]
MVRQWFCWWVGGVWKGGADVCLALHCQLGLFFVGCLWVVRCATAAASGAEGGHLCYNSALVKDDAACGPTQLVCNGCQAIASGFDSPSLQYLYAECGRMACGLPCTGALSSWCSWGLATDAMQALGVVQRETAALKRDVVAASM